MFVLLFHIVSEQMGVLWTSWELLRTLHRKWSCECANAWPVVHKYTHIDVSYVSVQRAMNIVLTVFYSFWPVKPATLSSALFLILLCMHMCTHVLTMCMCNLPMACTLQDAKCGYDSPVMGLVYKSYSDKQIPIWKASTALYPRWVVHKLHTLGRPPHTGAWWNHTQYFLVWPARPNFSVAIYHQLPFLLMGSWV